MKPTFKLSPAQREVLERAMTRGHFNDKPIGRISPGFCSISTERVLVERGLIEEDKFIPDAEERRNSQNLLTERIQGAKVALSAENWQMARSELNRANDIQQTLDRKAYWITDAGKAAL